MRIIEDIKLDFSDILLVPKRSTISSRKDIDLIRKFKFKYSNISWSGVPIISANMDSIITEKVVHILSENQMLACLPKSFEDKKICELAIKYKNVIPSHGVNVKDFKVPVPYPYFVLIDVANGYQERLLDSIKWMRDTYPHLTIISGNVVTPEMTEALILAGSDVVKIGVGSGAACKTRLQTKIGYPQFSAIVECGDAAHGLGAQIISDGGCQSPGDVVAAFGGNADFVMIGSLLSGHEENGTRFFGQSSKHANEQNAGGLKDYRASEGWELEVPLKGPLRDTIQDILGGLRSACSYVGATRLKDLPKCATFIKVNNQLNTSLWEYKK
jgi:GMP reductase